MQASPQDSPQRPAVDRLRVGVLVDLALQPEAGGHVKCWQHIAEAATRLPDELDLTVHFEGERVEERRLSEHVSYQLLPRALSSALVPLPIEQPNHTDLAPLHRRLRRFLPLYDVLHATDAWFAYARTSMRFHTRYGTPLVMSTHTDVPHYTQVFAHRLLERSRPGRWMLRHWDVDHRLEAVMQRVFDHYVENCDHILRRARPIIGGPPGSCRRTA